MATSDQLVQLLNSNALGNIALFIAAIVGVGGNYWLYRRKRKQRAQTLRRALFAEIMSMTPVIRGMERQYDAITMDPLDPRSFLIDSVYQASSDELGLLSEEEVTAVVDFYSTAISVQRVVGENFHTAYEQVARRDLHSKLIEATDQLRRHGGFDPLSPQSNEDVEAYEAQLNLSQ